MYKKLQLERKGYEISVRAAADNWVCELVVNGHGRIFFGATKGESLDRAVEYVEDLEMQYGKQQQRMRCEGCGD